MDKRKRTLTFVVISKVVADYLEMDAAVSTAPALRALAFVLAVVQRAQSMAATRVLASGCGKTKFAS